METLRSLILQLKIMRSILHANQRIVVYQYQSKLLKMLVYCHACYLFVSCNLIHVLSMCIFYNVLYLMYEIVTFEEGMFLIN